ncbi:MAG: hypothetical protein KGH60_00260 [Candidatus Micrarchaeota archaeon]|nr:hypothetical protein [Candidatus Micrarchaeota archaeon]
MDQEGIMYLVFALLMPLISISVLPAFGGGIFTYIALFIILVGVALILMINWVDFMLFSLVSNLLNISFQPAAGYKLVKGQDAILKEVNGLYYATGFVTGNLFAYTFKEEVGEETEDPMKLAGAPEKWERAIIGLGFPFKYHVVSAGLDVQKVRDDLEGKRSYKEYQLSRAYVNAANEVTITDLQRRISVIQAKIDRISQGEKPIATLMYVETTAIGISEKAALDSLTSQIKALQVSLSALDVDLIRVVGRELYTLFKFNFSLPTSVEELSSSFDQQG